MANAIVLSVFVGICALLQSALNRQLAFQWGLSGAVLFNSFIMFCAAGGCFALVVTLPDLAPDLFRNRGTLTSFSWWYLTPGLFGLAIVAGFPYAMDKVGALTASIVMIGAQLIASLVWDRAVEGIVVSPARVIGATLVLAGVAVASWKA